MGLQETLHDHWCMEMANPKLINDIKQKASKKQISKENNPLCKLERGTQVNKYLKQKQQQKP